MPLGEGAIILSPLVKGDQGGLYKSFQVLTTENPPSADADRGCIKSKKDLFILYMDRNYIE